MTKETEAIDEIIAEEHPFVRKLVEELDAAWTANAESRKGDALHKWWESRFK